MSATYTHVIFYMAALVFIVSSVCEQLFQVGCVFVRSRGSILDCWQYIIENRDKQLTERYLKCINAPPKPIQEQTGNNPFKKYLLLSTKNNRQTSISSFLSHLTFILQRDLMDDEICEFVHVEEELVDFACIEVSNEIWFKIFLLYCKHISYFFATNKNNYISIVYLY